MHGLRKYSSTHEFDDLRHFDLCEYTTPNVVTEIRRVSDSECVWALDNDLARLASIQFLHSLHFSKSNKVPVFKTMTGFIQAGDETFFVLEKKINIEND